MRENPANGRKNFYAGAHAQEVIGMEQKSARTLMDEISAFCTEPQFVYSHPWRLHDLVIWDNRSVLHRATTFDKTKYRRKMHRTTVAGAAQESHFATMPEGAAA